MLCLHSQVVIQLQVSLSISAVLKGKHYLVVNMYLCCLGLGMNAEELQGNPILTDFEVKDLNKDPKLPYPDNTFDVVTNAVSVDYLCRPLEVGCLPLLHS